MVVNNMDKATAREWYEAYKTLQMKDKQKQDAFYNQALNLARREQVEQRLVENALSAANWVEKQARKQARPSRPVAGLASWLI
jgi:hypothetical protein